MYWGILSTIVFSLFAYGRRAGWRRMGQEIASIPRVLRDTFVTGGTTAWAVLLAGGAISLAVAVLIGPAVAGILSVGLLLAAPSPISAIFGKVVSRLLIGLIRLFSAAKESDIPHLGGTVAGVAGTAAGMLVAWQMCRPHQVGVGRRGGCRRLSTRHEGGYPADRRRDAVHPCCGVGCSRCFRRHRRPG